MGKVLAIKRIHVTYYLTIKPEQQEAAEKVHSFHADFCPVARTLEGFHAEVTETTQRLKSSRQRAGVEFLEDLGNRALTSLWIGFARLATWQRSYNVVITNVPGPPRPVYLLDARMLEIYPLVPLAHNQALGIALFSYDGSLYWGLNSDWDALPDLHAFANAIEQEFEQLQRAADAVGAAEPVAD